MVRSFRLIGRTSYGVNSLRKCSDHARRPSSDTTSASFARDAALGTRDHPTTVAEWQGRAAAVHLNPRPRDATTVPGVCAAGVAATPIHNATLTYRAGVPAVISAHQVSARSTAEYGLVAQRLGDPKTSFKLCERLRLRLRHSADRRIVSHAAISADDGAPDHRKSDSP